MINDETFFNHTADHLAMALIGKVIKHRACGLWLSAKIIETEAYYLNEKGSHSSLGRTRNREPMFMPPGTIYMYYARGGDSLNFSTQGAGNAVLIKSAVVDEGTLNNSTALTQLLKNLGLQLGEKPNHRLLSGQTLMCKGLGLKVPDWWGKRLTPEQLTIEDTDNAPRTLIQTTRLGIPSGRDEHLMQRYIHPAYAKSCTKNPLTMRKPPPIEIIKNSG